MALGRGLTFDARFVWEIWGFCVSSLGVVDEPQISHFLARVHTTAFFTEKLISDAIVGRVCSCFDACSIRESFGLRLSTLGAVEEPRFHVTYPKHVWTRSTYHRDINFQRGLGSGLLSDARFIREL